MKHLLFITLVLCTSILHANETKTLFHIERSKNKNEVHYAVKLNGNCQFKGDEPIFGYWKSLEQGPNVIEDLSVFDQVAYGIVNQKVSGDKVTFNLKAIDSRVVTVSLVKKEKKCDVVAQMEISKKQAYLDKVYVLSKEGFIKPTVIHLDFFGHNEQGEQVTERYKP